MEDNLPEWANLDCLLAKLIAEKLQLFREKTNGFPINYSSADEWDNKLNSIIVRLESYPEKFQHAYDIERELEQAGVQAIRELADIFPQLWD